MNCSYLSLVLLFFLGLNLPLICQNVIMPSGSLGLHNYDRPSKLNYNEIDGSPYLLKDYVLGKAMRTDGVYIDSLSMKYDLATFHFIALDDNNEIAINGIYYKQFVLEIDGEEVLFKRVDPKTPERFYEIIYEGEELTIYKVTVVKMEKGKYSGISKSNDRFFKKTKYMVRVGRNTEKVKLKKKNLWKYFDVDQQRILEEYIKENNIKLKKDKDFRSLFKILHNGA